MNDSGGDGVNMPEFEMDISCVLAALLLMLPLEKHEKAWVYVRMLTPFFI